MKGDHGSDRAEQAAFDKLTRLLLSCRDFQEALSAATFLLEEIEEDQNYMRSARLRFRCFETTMVVAYARPFSNARGNVLPLTWKLLKTDLTERQRSLHDKLIAYRNTLYAHSDAEAVEMRGLVLRQHLDRSEPFEFIVPRFNETLKFSVSEIRELHNMLPVFVQTILKQAQKGGQRFRDRFTILSLDEDAT